MKGSYHCPSKYGSKGLPPGVGSSKGGPRKGGFVSPSQIGSKGKPHSKGFPNTPAPKD